MKRLLKSALMCVLAWWTVLPLHAQVVTAATSSTNAAERAPVDERAMKAAYLYNFAVFTQWPKLSAPSFQFCVLGTSAVGDELRRLQGRPVQEGLPLMVRNVMPGDDLESCHLLYVDEGQRRLFPVTLKQLNGYPVLTVSDAEGVVEQGVMIEVRRQGSRLAFDVNLPAARRVKLDFSARLLKLASFVVNKP
jgi:hypothetical protein